ncbi:hypothetical protein THSYN_25025 [Candidatus Thiodictyon syntrophicum]|jgi:lipopolysaccharide transport system ATP-binding protein|uniref:ABC transporter domain-containing protein n=1 Tax=Candidatus Thiodictyon syntrophicum TaxID=1166950 RepID=A0A2K8UE57_9GAMM|nr:ABC transporter ATP-binding protein [Candidatus Thiodictyon syntrophicum]AUB83884.1 hypothetical protein THSYN_25025 [Candidatus Thiodictyon syntrophicum]
MPAIKVENLSKSYLVGHNAAQGERYTALRDVIARNARDLARKTRDMIHGRPIIQGDSVEEFWALKDVSFEIEQGDRVGIIGRNGAGKSTLLKILSRITEPTKGRIEINGRVASLLEVGTGFHPELSGRENILLNGAILGMSRKEVLRKFDEIVDFAEVEKFLDTPVKRYSSGMYVRLAFAVAAHLESEILIVDEVLAVGDVQFQKKCLRKMRDVTERGRSVLFVSHNMAAISSLCDKAIFLENGLIITVGSVSNVIDKYLNSGLVTAELFWKGPFEHSLIRVESAEIVLGENEGLLSHNPILVKTKIKIKKQIIGLVIGWELKNIQNETLAYSLFDDLDPISTEYSLQGCYEMIMRIPPDTLAAGDYILSLDVGIHNIKRLVPEKLISLGFRLENTAGIGRRYLSARFSIFRPDWNWSISKTTTSATL